MSSTRFLIGWMVQKHGSLDLNSSIIVRRYQEKCNCMESRLLPSDSGFGLPTYFDSNRPFRGCLDWQLWQNSRIQAAFFKLRERARALFSASWISLLTINAVYFMATQPVKTVFVNQQELLSTAREICGLQTLPTMIESLLFANNAYYPITLMPDWLQSIVRSNSLIYSFDIARQPLLDSPVMSGLVPDFVALLLFAAALLTIGILLSLRFLTS